MSPPDASPDGGLDGRPYAASPGDYRAAALTLLPQGRAWPTDEPDSALARAWAAVADGYARHHARTLDLLHGESDPAAAFELLPEWERTAGLPDDCAPADATLEERRAALVARLAGRGGQTVGYFEALAAALGYDATVTERRPFTCGRSQCGGAHEIAPPAIRNRWRLAVAGPRVERFRVGAGQCGVHALTMLRRAEDLECRLARLKPAQSAVTIGYEGV